MPHADVVGQLTLKNFDKGSQYRSRVLTTLHPWSVKTTWVHGALTVAWAAMSCGQAIAQTRLAEQAMNCSAVFSIFF